jgi:hypothetical protein
VGAIRLEGFHAEQVEPARLLDQAAKVPQGQPDGHSLTGLHYLAGLGWIEELQRGVRAQDVANAATSAHGRPILEHPAEGSSD